MNNPQFNPYVSNIQNQLAQAYQNVMQPQPQQNGCYMQIVDDEMTVLRWGVAAGQSMFFYNPTSGILYLKSTSQNNIPEPLRKFSVTEITNQNAVPIQQTEQPQVMQATIEATPETVTREEFSEVLKTLNQIQASLKELTD